MKPVLRVLGFWVIAAALAVISTNTIALASITIVALFLCFCDLSYLIYRASKDHFDAQ